MKRIFVFLITGFEEIEALATVDILRRAGLNVQTVSLTGERTVSGSHGVTVAADMLFEEVPFGEADLLVVPGGTPAYDGHEGLKREVLGILRGRRATCYPGFEKYLEGATLCTDLPVVVDGHVVTGQGPGLTVEFALTLVELMAGRDKRGEIARQLLVG